MFAFIRQEVARSTERSPGGHGGGGGVEGGDANGAVARVDAELSEKRAVILAQLPRLMELNKVRMAVRPRLGRGGTTYVGTGICGVRLNSEPGEYLYSRV